MLINVLNINLNNCINGERVDVVLVSDPYKVDDQSSAWYVDSGSWCVTTWFASDRFIISDVESNLEFVSVKVNSIRIFLFYISTELRNRV